MYLTKCIPIKIYDTQIQFIITSDILRTVNNIYKKYNTGMNVKDSMAGCMIGLSINKYHIIIDSQYFSYNTLIHELYHCVRSIIGDRYIENEESAAWLQGYLAQEIFEFIKLKKLTKLL